MSRAGWQFKGSALTAAMLVVFATLTMGSLRAQVRKAPNLAGVYRALDGKIVLPGGLRNEGSPADLQVTPAAAERLRTEKPGVDPASMCQPVGPFRMMAREAVTIEIVPVLSRNLVMLLFEDISHGHLRTLRVDGTLPSAPEPTWHGHSVASWDGDAFVVNTTGFNDRIWLNDAGVRPSPALRLTERFRLVLADRYLEYRVVAEDPDVLARPASYVRYFERLSTEIGEDLCEQ